LQYLLSETGTAVADLPGRKAAEPALSISITEGSAERERGTERESVG